MEPARKPEISKLLSASKIIRPHYLDNDLAYLYPEPGNRAMLFTLVSEKADLFFMEEMGRQVFWWKTSQLPESKDLRTFEEHDGVLIQADDVTKQILLWQENMAEAAESLTEITFSNPLLQKNWIRLTAHEDYWLDVLPDR